MYFEMDKVVGTRKDANIHAYCMQTHSHQNYCNCTTNTITNSKSVIFFTKPNAQIVWSKSETRESIQRSTQNAKIPDWIHLLTSNENTARLEIPF